LAGLLATSAAAIFPVVLHSTLAPENSLSAYDVAAGANSLAYAAIWWPIGFALAAAYFVFVSRRYAGKVSVQRDKPGFYSTCPMPNALTSEDLTMNSNCTTTTHKPRIIIVGGGFGGLAAARALKNASAHVLLIDKTNHHVFQPLLYQVATSVLSPENIG